MDKIMNRQSHCNSVLSIALKEMKNVEKIKKKIINTKEYHLWCARKTNAM